MKAKDVAFFIIFVILIVIVIKLSSKLQETDQRVTLLSAQMDATAVQIHSAMQQAAQHKVPATVRGFGADV